MPDHSLDTVVLLGIFAAALVGVVILFRYLHSTAQTSGVRIGGALAGFLLVFGLLYLSYSRLFERTHLTFLALLLFHCMALLASWVLFRKLESTADVAVRQVALKDLLGVSTLQKLRVGGALAGYVIVYSLLYAVYVVSIDRPMKLEYSWHQDPSGPAVVIARYFEGVTKGVDCDKAYRLLTKRLIEERKSRGQMWVNATEFCKYYATNLGHWNIAYKRIKSADERVRYYVALDFKDGFVRNELAAMKRRLRDYPGLCSEDQIFDVLRTTVERHGRELTADERGRLRAEIGKANVSTLVDHGAIHYYLRKLGIERDARDAISFFQQLPDSDTIAENGFHLKIVTLVADPTAQHRYLLDRIDTPLIGTYSGDVPAWRF